MNTTVLVIFAFAYLGMILGEIPGFALDRTSVALLATERVSPEAAWEAVDVPTVGLLIANLIVAEQVAKLGIQITWREHAPVGVPVTLFTLAVAAGWLWLLSP